METTIARLDHIIISVLEWVHCDPENVVDVLLDARSVAENETVDSIVDAYLRHVAEIGGGSWRQVVDVLLDIRNILAAEAAPVGAAN